MKPRSIQNLLDWLEVKGLLTNRNQAEAQILCEQNQSNVPMYIHVLMGLGALIGCSFINLLLFSMNILSTENYSYLYAGLSFIGLSLLMYYGFRYAKPLLQSFAIQTALIFMLSGKTLFVYGAYLKLPLHWGTAEHLWAITLSLMFITLLTYSIFPNVIDRFLSVLATLISSSVTLSIEFEHNIPLFIIYSVTLLCVLGLYSWQNRTKKWDPLVIACLAFLCLLSIFLSCYTLASLSHSNSFWKIPPLFFNLMLGAFTIGVCIILSHSKNKTTELPVILACIGIALLALVSNNGILLSIALLLLGYGKHQRVLITFGVIFLIAFIIRYYYSLSLSLEYKAFILIGTGAFLIFVRAIMKYATWDQD